MNNIFDDPDGTFYVLQNQELQLSLWPMDLDVPAGWRRIHGPDNRLVCLDFVEKHWNDMRPKSLVDGGVACRVKL
jgi:MbtH protein